MSVVMTARERVAGALAESLYDNPVVIKAFRTRMRGWKAFLVMGAYVAVMTAVLLIAYFAYAQIYAHSGMRPSRVLQASIGKSLFGTLIWAQSFLLTLIIPALSSGALTHELEKRTIEMLALTRLSAGKIVVGKQVSDFVYTLILLACSLPLSGICVMLGGISPLEIAVAYTLLVGWSYLLTCTGIMWSSLSKKTATASFGNFGLCLLYFIVTLVVPLALGIGSYYSHRPATSYPFMFLNPAYAGSDALQSTIVCGIKLPMALVAMALYVAFGSMFVLIATTHVKYRVVERALPIRLLIIGITVLVIWLAVGASTSSLSNASVAGPGIAILALSMVGAAIFGTGAINKSENQSVFDYALSPRRAFRSDVGGAIAFVVLWVLVAYGVFGLTALLRPAALVAAVPQSASHTGPLSPFGPRFHATGAFWPSYLEAGLAIVIMAAATAAVGVLASAVTRKRSSAAALVVLFVIVAFAGFAVLAANSSAMPGSPRSSACQLAALWPLTPILALTGDWPFSYSISPSWLANAWLVSCIVYSLIGALALGLASSAYRSTGGVVMEE